MKYIAARYVSEGMKVMVKLNSGKMVEGLVDAVVREPGQPKREGRVHVMFTQAPHTFTLDPDQSIAIYE